MHQRGTGQPRHEGRILDRIPGPVAAPAQFVIGPGAAQHDTDGQKAERRQGPAAHHRQPVLGRPARQQRRQHQRERNRKAHVTHVEHRRVDGHARVLQQRVQVPPVAGNRQKARERIGQEQDQPQETGTERPLHRQRNRQTVREMAPAVPGKPRRPGHQNHVPQVQRTLVSTPHGADLVDQRQGTVGVLRHVPDREVVGHEGLRERGPAEHGQRQLQPGAAHRDAGQLRPTQRPRQQRRNRLQQGHRQRQHDREVAEFDQLLIGRDHRMFRSPPRGRERQCDNARHLSGACAAGLARRGSVMPPSQGHQCRPRAEGPQGRFS